MNAVYFDDSLSKFVQILVQHLSPEAVAGGLFVRDALGRLAFFSSAKLSRAAIARLSKAVILELGEYARKDRPIADRSDFGVDGLFSEHPLRVSAGQMTVALLDRRLVGADWLRSPVPVSINPPRFVFASLKGGVGRTTALSVSAAELAAQGKSVLILDLDLEAPGIGSMLLDEGTTPEFGMIDALVEIGLKELDDAFMADLVGPSGLADRSGRIDVIPAFGKRSLQNPGDVLAKISRAYAEKIDDRGRVFSFLDKVSLIVDYFSGLDRYDVMLVDARAGLHETTASALLGLGAHVFLFGLDEPQTFQGYGALLSHLARIEDIVKDKAKWISGISMVQGKAPREDELLASYKESVENLFKKSGLIGEKANVERVALPAEPFFNVPWMEDDELTDDELVTTDQSVETLHIRFDEEFILFDPSRRRNLLSRSVYEPPFKTFLEKVEAVMSQYTEEER